MTSKSKGNLGQAAVNMELIVAAGAGNTSKVKKLLAPGLLRNAADVNAYSDVGGTALIIASMRGRTEVVRILMENGADPKVKDVFGKNAEYYAGLHRNKDIINLLNINANEQRDIMKVREALERVRRGKAGE